MSKSDRVPLPPLNVICDHLSLIDVDLSLPDDAKETLSYNDIIRLLRGGNLYDKTILIRNHLLTIGVDTSDVDTVRAIKSMLSKKGILKQLDNGYYEIILGAFGASAGSYLRHNQLDKIADKQLRSEWGHPPNPQDAARMIALLNPTKFSIVNEEDE